MTDAANAVADRYSIPIVRELFYGNGRFSDLAQLVAAPRTVLARRLRKLEAVGIVQRHRYSERPPRDEYALTAAGRELLPVLIAFKEWGDAHCDKSRQSERLKFAHRCGKPLRTETVCAGCRKVVRFEDLVVSGPIRPRAAQRKTR